MNIEKAKKHAKRKGDFNEEGKKRKVGRPRKRRRKPGPKAKPKTPVVVKQKKVKAKPEKPIRIIVRDALSVPAKPTQRVIVRTEPEPEPEIEEVEVDLGIEEYEEPEVKVIPSKKPDFLKEKKIADEMKDLINVMEEFDEHDMPISATLFKSHQNPTEGYSFSEKMRALSILRGTARDLNGKLVPYFKMVERWTGVTSKSLAIWWANRETIIANSQGIVGEIETLAKYEISMMMLETINELRSRLAEIDKNSVSFQELTNLFDKSVNKLMIMTGKPQQPRRVDHFHHLPVNTIAPDTAE